jgi:hypothetical protein
MRPLADRTAMPCNALQMTSAYSSGGWSSAPSALTNSSNEARSGAGVSVLANRQTARRARLGGQAFAAQQCGQLLEAVEGDCAHDGVLAVEVAVEHGLAVFDPFGQLSSGHRLPAFGLGQLAGGRDDQLLTAPQSAADFGIPGTPTQDRNFQAWLPVKAVRDIASGCSSSS